MTHIFIVYYTYIGPSTGCTNTVGLILRYLLPIPEEVGASGVKHVSSLDPSCLLFRNEDTAVRRFDICFLQSGRVMSSLFVGLLYPRLGCETLGTISLSFSNGPT